MTAPYITAPYVNGQTIEADPTAMIPVTNPASGEAFSPSKRLALSGSELHLWRGEHRSDLNARFTIL